MTDSVLCDVRDGVATLTLNRPEALNALNLALAQRLAERVQQVEHDAAVRCVVIRGAGGHFMAGGDLKYFKGELAKPEEERRRFFRAMVESVHPTMIAIRRV